MSFVDGTEAAQSYLTPININTVGAGELSKRLYGIGPALAARIVTFRQLHGPFCGPDDLARVDGVSTDLAWVLAPHIDWTHTIEEEITTDYWPGPLSGLIILIICAVQVIGTVSAILQDVGVAHPTRWFHLWIDVGGLLSFAGAGSGILFLTVLRQSGKLQVYAAEYRRIGLYSLVVFLFGMLNMGLGYAAAFTFVSSVGWRAFLRSPSFVLLTVSMLLFAICVGAAVIVALHPKYVRNRWLNRLVNGSLLLLPLSMAFEMWLSEDNKPIWLLFATSAVSLGFAWDIVRGTSYLDIWSKRLSGRFQEDSGNLWLRWVNQKLPDPEQQKALLEALQQAHPLSRWQTLQSLVITGAVSWIIVGTGSAVWEWVVQNWLEGWRNP